MTEYNSKSDSIQIKDFIMNIQNLFLFSFLLLLNCGTIKEAIDCERYRDKDYPSAVSNCSQTQKEFNNKIDTVREVRK